MKYVNQLEYPHVSYPTRVKEEPYAPNGIDSTVEQSGCGLCSVCMAVDILTDTTLDIEECVRISMECGANHGTGTDMNVFGPVIAERFGLDYLKSCDLSEAIRHLREGGVIIAYMGVPEGKETGLFTKVGHYILLVSTDDKEFCILDPNYSPEKFTIPEREGRVNTRNAPYLYCDVNTVDSETRPNRVKYFMFKRIKK